MMSRLFNCWCGFCQTLERAGYKSDEIYREWYAFFEKHPTLYL